ncbi:hypothetical protein GCK32_010015 [Trichostrongylus colubriformis]|uniref:Uncharacterized protein n=1 Tax=Trichostrongylus colubriformis TaxID=6319 RepID=A0AAN8FJ56_TRICO
MMLKQLSTNSAHAISLALLTAADAAKTETPPYDPKTTTPLYQFIPIPVVPLSTPFPGTILRMTSAGNPVHSVPGVIIYPHADNQSQGALIKPGIGYGLNGPMALPNRLAFILSGLINGFANNVHNFIESLGITAG